MDTFILELVITHAALILAYWVFLRKENEYYKMRIYLIGATVFSILLPLLRLPKLFPADNPVVQDVQGVAVTFAPSIVTTAETPIITFDKVMCCSLIISSVFLLKLFSRIIYLIRLEGSSTAEQYKSVSILRASNITGSFTFFNWIFLNSDLDSSQHECDTIIEHEQAHVNMKHSYDLIFFEVFKALFWWLPSAWYINKEIRNIHEYQADAYVLKSINIDLYSSILIKSTLQSNGLNIASSFQEGLIFKRLKAMKQQTKEVRRWKLGILTSLCLFLFVFFACSEENNGVSAQSIRNETTPSEKAVVKVEEVFKIVEQQPSFKGGMSAFYSYVINEMRYPLEARKSGVEGVVEVGFVVERDGSVSNVRVINGIGSGCDKEAVNVIKNTSGFTPGVQRGRTVRVAMTMPITFKLNPGKKNPDNSVQGIIIAGELNPNNGTLDVKSKNNNGLWSGTVLSPEGDAIPGANIVIIGTNKGTVSDRDGSFSITASEGQELQVSFVGYTNVILR